jgi:phosphate transport system substrate-binding protein
MSRKWMLLMSVATVGLSALVSGCKSLGIWGPPDADDPMGDVSIDGSTTVYPIVQAMAEDFKAAHPEYSPAVNKSGTGSGFQKFTRSEIDVAAASRPIDATEDAELKQKGIEYIEIPIAYDGVSVVVNPKNNWVSSLTLKELRNAWRSESAVKLWSDIRPSFPGQPITFHGPTDNHGTYEYFTEAVNGKKNDIRSDCQKDQEYNSIIQAVAGDVNSMAYVGFNYYDQNRDKVKIVSVDSGNGPVAPSAETIADGAYAPLSRPLFLYVNKRAYDRKVQVKAFVQFALSQAGETDVKESSYVVLPADLHEAILRHVQAETTGTLFAQAAPGTKLIDLYKKSEGR